MTMDPERLSADDTATPAGEEDLWTCLGDPLEMKKASVLFLAKSQSQS